MRVLRAPSPRPPALGHITFLRCSQDFSAPIPPPRAAPQLLWSPGAAVAALQAGPAF